MQREWRLQLLPQFPVPCQLLLVDGILHHQHVADSIQAFADRQELLNRLVIAIEVHRYVQGRRNGSDCFDGFHNRVPRTTLDFDALELAFQRPFCDTPNVDRILAAAPVVDQHLTLRETTEHLVYRPCERLADGVIAGHLKTLVASLARQTESRQIEVEEILAPKERGIPSHHFILQIARSFTDAHNSRVGMELDDELRQTWELRQTVRPELRTVDDVVLHWNNYFEQLDSGDLQALGGAGRAQRNRRQSGSLDHLTS